MSSSGAINCESKLQSVVALSTMEAEHIPMVHASNEAIWLKWLLGDFKVKQDTVRPTYDSQSVLHLGKSSVFYSRTKYIDIRYDFIRDV